MSEQYETINDFTEEVDRIRQEEYSCPTDKRADLERLSYDLSSNDTLCEEDKEIVEQKIEEAISACEDEEQTEDDDNEDEE